MGVERGADQRSCEGKARNDFGAVARLEGDLCLMKGIGGEVRALLEYRFWFDVTVKKSSETSNMVSSHLWWLQTLFVHVAIHPESLIVHIQPRCHSAPSLFCFSLTSHHSRADRLATSPFQSKTVCCLLCYT